MIRKDSPDWPGAKAWLQQEIERRRQSLEADTCGIKEADLLRGEIRAFRGIISHVEPSLGILAVDHPSPEGAAY